MTAKSEYINITSTTDIESAYSDLIASGETVYSALCAIRPRATREVFNELISALRVLYHAQIPREFRAKFEADMRWSTVRTESATNPKELEQATNTQEAQEKNEQKPEQKEKADRFALMQYIKAGFTLYAQSEGTNKGGRYYVDFRKPCKYYPKGVKKDQSAIKTESDLHTALENGVTLFCFVPADCGLICLDLDKGHSDGVNGVESFRKLLEQANIDPKAIFGGVRVESVSGGLHLYYRDDFRGDYKTTLGAGVEVRGGKNKQALTAAGSMRNGKQYTMRGNLAEIPIIPLSLLRLVRKPNPAPETLRKPTYNRERGNFALDRLIDYALKDHSTDGRNQKAYFIGFRVGSQYDAESVISACASLPDFADFPESELRTAIQSGIKNSKY